jgi:hypothetical protein
VVAGETIAGMAKKPIGLLRYVIGLEYGVPFIASAAGGAIGVIGFQQFRLGFYLFAIAGVGLIAHWCVSEPMRHRPEALDLPATRKYELRLAAARKDYWKYLIARIVAIIASTAAALYWTNEQKLAFERDDVTNNIKMSFRTPDDHSVMNSKFS